MDDADLLAGLPPEVLLTRILGYAHMAAILTRGQDTTVGAYYRCLADHVRALDEALRRGDPWPLAWAGDREPGRPVADVPLSDPAFPVPRPAREPALPCVAPRPAEESS